MNEQTPVCNNCGKSLPSQQQIFLTQCDHCLSKTEE